LRTRGVEAAIKAVTVLVRKVMGIRCVGHSQEGLRVRIVAIRDRGSCEEGVRISRVRAASIGASRRAEIAVAVVAIMTVTSGEVELRILLSEMVVEVFKTDSISATPKAAARKLRKKVSNVRRRTE